MQALKIEGYYGYELWRTVDKNRQVMVDKGEGTNGIVDGGREWLLNVMFDIGTTSAPAALYLGLLDNSFGAVKNDTTNTLTLCNTHQYASYTTPISPERVAWSAGAAGDSTSAGYKEITNSSTCNYTISGTGDLYGFFVTDDINTTSGSLWSVAEFDSRPIAVVNTDTVKLTYTVKIAVAT